MKANSILSHLTAQNTVSELKLLLHADFRREKTFVLFEGEDDIRLFRFLMHKNVTLVRSYGAKTAIDALIPRILSDRRVIAVRDRDYQETPKSERIFYCDHCCCEMMMIADDRVFAKVTANFYEGDLSPEALREKILRQLYYVSLIRKYSDRFRWKLKINDIPLTMFRPGKASTLDEAVEMVNRKNKQYRISQKKVRFLRNAETHPSLEELLDITNGHDFLKVLRNYCANAKRRYPGEKQLAAALRCAFDVSAFSRTELFRELKKYEQKTQLHLVTEEI